MKKILVVLLMVIFSSCDNNNPVQLSYYKDKRTGLCFSTLGYGTNDHPNENTMSCVPCDSLKNVSVVELNSISSKK